jgi:hypothetical protein
MGKSSMTAAFKLANQVVKHLKLANQAVKVAAQNGGIVETPSHFHPVVLEPPKAKREKYPFQGYIDFQGLKIDVENKAGSDREGESPEGKPWKTHMYYHYGEIRGTEGTDGDKLDVYVGENHDASLALVVHQYEPETGKYDEDKVMLGFDSVEAAIGAYKRQYDRPGFYRDGEHTAMPIGQFWRWVQDKNNKGKKLHKDAAVRIASAYMRSTLTQPLRTRADYASDQMPGGRADKKKPSDFDPKELAMGIEVEKEHTNDPDHAREIGMDHLTEDPKYYTHLKEMEDKYVDGAGDEKHALHDMGPGIPSAAYQRKYATKPASKAQVDHAGRLLAQAKKGGWWTDKVPSAKQLAEMNIVDISTLIDKLKKKQPFEAKFYGNGQVRFVKKAESDLQVEWSNLGGEHFAGTPIGTDANILIVRDGNGRTHYVEDGVYDLLPGNQRSAAARFPNLTKALEPFLEDPDDVKDQVQDFVDHFREEARPAFKDIEKCLRPLKGKRGGSDSNSQNVGRNYEGETYYSWEITFAEEVTLGCAVKIDFRKAWKGALTAFRRWLTPGAERLPLTSEISKELAKTLQEETDIEDYLPEYLSSKTEEKIEDWMANKFLFDVDVTTTTYTEEGEDVHPESMSPEVHFDMRGRPEQKKTKSQLQGTTWTMGVTLPVSISIHKVVTPYDHGYRMASYTLSPGQLYRTMQARRLRVETDKAWSKLAAEVLPFPQKLPTGPHIKIRGKKYYLSDHMGFVLNDPDGPGPLDEQEGGARFHDMGGNKWRYLWVLDVDKDLVAMWRVSDGDEKAGGRARSYTSDIRHLDKKRQLNRVSTAEFKMIERDMQRRYREALADLKRYISETETDYQKVVNDATREYTKKFVIPKVVQALQAVDRGVIPMRFKFSPNLEQHGITREHQMKTRAIDGVMMSLLTPQAVDRYLKAKGLYDENEDNQASYWAINDVREELVDRYYPKRASYEVSPRTASLDEIEIETDWL